MIVILGETRWDAWIDAAQHLINSGEQLNLVLSIENPASDGRIGKQVRQVLDNFYSSKSAQPLHTVAETIFPAWEYQRRGLGGMFKAYTAAFQRLRVNNLQWGTYAHRIMSRTASDGSEINPLQGLIGKMRDARSKNRRWKACYEIGVAEPDYDIPVYDSIQDKNRRRALPCLTHLSFKLYDDKVHLTAMYRSHEYIYKTPGNLLGLARLQACVAREVGIPLGTLVVHSTYAFADAAKRDAKKLMQQIIDVSVS